MFSLKSVIATVNWITAAYTGMKSSGSKDEPIATTAMTSTTLTISGPSTSTG